MLSPTSRTEGNYIVEVQTKGIVHEYAMHKDMVTMLCSWMLRPVQT